MGQILHRFPLFPPFIFTYELGSLMIGIQTIKPGKWDLNNLNELSECGTG